MQLKRMDSVLQMDREVILVRNRVEKVEPKSFTEEIRANVDIEKFMVDTKVILDVHEISLHKILEIGLTRIIGEPFDLKQCLSVLCLTENVPKLKDTFQSMTGDDNGYFAFDQSWICVFASLPFLTKRLTGIIRLASPVNFGDNANEIRFLVMVLVPVKEKGTKNAIETGRTFSTLFTSAEFRNDLLNAKNVPQFLAVIKRRTNELAEDSKEADKCKINKSELPKEFTKEPSFQFKLTFGSGVAENFSRRLKYYKSDFVDGIRGPNTIRKTLATIFFLYFACILPCVAFGVLLDKTTEGLIDARRAIIGQAIGGLIFALFSGQPLVIISTTAPLCLYTKVVFEVAKNLNVDFYAMFACVGLWNALYVLLFALLDASVIMKWCTRNTEEIFSIFSFFAFALDALSDAANSFKAYYPGFGCDESLNLIKDKLENSTINIAIDSSLTPCKPESAILFVLLMLGTLWLGWTLYNFNRTPFLSSTNRDILSDYALPIAVVTFSFIASYVFQAIDVERFQFRDGFHFTVTSLDSLTPTAILLGAGLGFPLSLLFFMDQNISAALVNSPSNNLKKGDGYHLDLLIVGILNAFTSMFGLPWMNGMLPHSPLHARSLADFEERVENGYVKQVVVYVRETRITGIVAHILIGFSLYLIPYPLSYIPVPVLDGLYLYCAFSFLRGNAFYERMLLLITEQSAYPPTHYIRRAPQRYIHSFTFLQIIQTAILCCFGFWSWPYIRTVFPVIIALLIPIRHLLIPHIIPEKYLSALDSYH